MRTDAGGLSRWTHYFTVTSALGLVAVYLSMAIGIDRYGLATVALFGFVCPMIFGMAYLLLPSFAATTLTHQRLPGLHFGLAYAGASALIGVQLGVLTQPARTLGVMAWSLGVALFLAELVWTILPAIRERPGVILRSAQLPQRSTRLATAAIPVALGYLAVGTLALLGDVGVLPTLGPTALPSIAHYYGTGFGALLVFALGTRLMPGFFHVTPPPVRTWVVLLTGAVGPALLATHLWAGPWFRVGAVLEAVAMVAYAAVVGSVYLRSEWTRVSFVGIGLGALAGVSAVAVGLLMAFQRAAGSYPDAHATLILGGFFPLTIAGYAYHFFPVTDGQFIGASERTALSTLGALAVGCAVTSIGHLTGIVHLTRGGPAVGLFGAAGYAYLVSRRLL